MKRNTISRPDALNRTLRNRGGTSPQRARPTDAATRFGANSVIARVLSWPGRDDMGISLAIVNNDAFACRRGGARDGVAVIADDFPEVDPFLRPGLSDWGAVDGTSCTRPFTQQALRVGMRHCTAPRNIVPMA